jgi:hypothetical protein
VPAIGNGWAQLDAGAFERLADGAGFETQLPADFCESVTTGVDLLGALNELRRHLLLRTNSDALSLQVGCDRVAVHLVPASKFESRHTKAILLGQPGSFSWTELAVHPVLV